MTSSAGATTGESPRVYPQLLLFGDSITQGASQTVQAWFSEWYSRRLDVLNRGFGGYTAPLGLKAMEQFFPTVAPSPKHPRIRLMTVFFGANDACLPGTSQHVPLREYKDSLRGIINHPGVKLHDTKIILIVPAPVDEWQLSDNTRTAMHTAKYASACREVGQEFNLPALDLWTSFMSRAGWRDGDSEPLIGSRAAAKNQVLGSLLNDGLHFTNEGYKLMHEELVALIRSKLASEVPETLPMVFPDWKDLLEATD